MNKKCTKIISLKPYEHLVLLYIENTQFFPHYDIAVDKVKGWT